MDIHLFGQLRLMVGVVSRTICYAEKNSQKERGAVLFQDEDICVRPPSPDLHCTARKKKTLSLLHQSWLQRVHLETENNEADKYLIKMPSSMRFHISQLCAGI